MKWWAFGHLFTREPERISMEPLDKRPAELARNLVAHARMRVGFMVADRHKRDGLSGDRLLDAIASKWCSR